ncbi:VCBS repeat-containing protein [Nostocales cyanobacterium LEGE 12452]|nr:VCBS repeat-containing protein [Nostocales cyanobacterium LEGE 12452]
MSQMSYGKVVLSFFLNTTIIGAMASVAVAEDINGFNITNYGIGEFAGWATAGGVQILTGDFNNDGRTDVALLRQSPGWTTMPVAFANGNGTWQITNYSIDDFASWATTSGVQILTGDFNNDGSTDVALLRQNAGWTTMPVAFANGNGTWQITNYSIGDFASWATAGGVRPLTGDFNNDGRTDVALLRQSAGWTTMPVAFANGNGTWQITNYSIDEFAGWATAGGVRPLTGDFNNDGSTDIALLRQNAGWTTMPVAFANGNGTWQITNYSIGEFAGWATAGGVRPLTGDFNNDGSTDVALLRQSPGWTTMPVAFANGNGTWQITNYSIGDFAGWATASGVRSLTGDFNNDNRTDVLLLRQNAGWTTMPIAFPQ